MNKSTLTALALSLPLIGSELPPVIPVGPVTYDSVNYQPAAAPADNTVAPYSDGTETYVPAATGYTAPIIAPAASSTPNTVIDFNVYTSDYQVRGMGVTDHLSEHGFSSVSASHTFANRNLFNKGIHHRIGGTYGLIWDGSYPLGETPLLHLNYAMGKEIFPNLNLEVGYGLKRGGLEGFAARFYNGKAHRIAQDVNLTLVFNDYQKGFFGHAIWGYGFQGLTGSYFDFELGYRFTDVVRGGNMGADIELSAGIAPSLGYWGAGVEGIDAYRIKAAFAPYSHSGSFGRDARFQVKPWVQCSWSGSNAGKIDRLTAGGPVDHFQVTIGVDLGWRF